jgi:hypothetical protein
VTPVSAEFLAALHEPLDREALLAELGGTEGDD